MDVIPTIQVSFTSNEELHGVVMTAYIKTIGDAIRASQNDYRALEDLHRLFTEAKWITGDMMGHLWAEQNLPKKDRTKITLAPLE